jgi:hypothetical protein
MAKILAANCLVINPSKYYMFELNWCSSIRNNPINKLCEED